MVSHVLHDVTDRDGLDGLDPEGKVVDLAHVAVDVREIFVNLSGVVVMAVEAPDSGLAVADGAEIHGAIGLTEAEFSVWAIVISFLLGEGDSVGAVQAIAIVGDKVTELLVNLLGLGELLDAAGVGVGADAIVGDSPCDPDGALVSLAFSDYLHYPSLVLVADSEGLAGAVVAIFLDQLMDAVDSLTGCGNPLKHNAHEGEIIKITFRVPELLAAAPGCFHNADLVLIHQTDNSKGVRDLFDKTLLGGRSPAPELYKLTLGMTAGSAVIQRRREAETVAVISADHTSVNGGFLSYNKVGAGK